MNPLFERAEELGDLQTALEDLEEDFETARQNYLKSCFLIKEKMQAIKNTCSHVDKDGSSAWKYTGQDPNSGRLEHYCKICGKSD